MNNNSQKIVQKTSLIGLFANLVLVFIKLFVGVISRSQAMIADGLHSVEDSLVSFMAYIGSKISSKPKDNKHPYGYGKAEYIISELISLTMITAAYIMFVNSIKSIFSTQHITFSIWLVLVCVITIITKISLYIYTSMKLKQNKNILINASKIDHRNDIFMTSATLIGIISSYFGFYLLDVIVASIISVVISISGFKLFIISCKVLMDTNLSEEKLVMIVNNVEKNGDILHVDSITSKPISSKYLLLLKVSMDNSNTLRDSHEVAGRIKADILSNFLYIEDVIIHVNPH